MVRLELNALRKNDGDELKESRGQEGLEEWVIIGANYVGHTLGEQIAGPGGLCPVSELHELHMAVEVHRDELLQVRWRSESGEESHVRGGGESKEKERNLAEQALFGRLRTGLMGGEHDNDRLHAHVLELGEEALNESDGLKRMGPMREGERKQIL